MADQQTIRQNGSGDSDNIRDELDQIGQVLNSADSNPLLKEVNAGQGNYSKFLIEQQKDAYWKGLIADKGFSSLLIDRAIESAKQSLARNGIAFYDEDQNEVQQFSPLSEEDIDESESCWNAERKHGKEIWRQLGRPDKAITEKQIAAMVKATGLDPAQWLPIVWQYFIGVHEMSRSLDAELLKLYLGQTYTVRDNAEDENTTQTILRKR